MSIRTKLMIILFLTITLLVLLLAFVLRVEIHQCFGLACEEVTSLSPSVSQALQKRFDQALTQSLMWTLPAFIFLVALIVSLMSRAITKRILWMRQQAVRIASGNLDASFPVHGKDELSALAETLNYLSSELSKQETFRQSLMQDVAHELRTPLMTLKSHIEAFIDGVWEPSPDRLRSCIEEVERFESLVKSVEMLYEADHVATITSDPTDLQAITQQVVQLFVPRCNKIGLDLLVDAREDPVLVYAQPADLSQTVWNLVDNAVKYTPPGGTIRVSLGSSENGVYVQVADTGMGIPEHELGNIFERFYRVDKSRDRSRGGSGLGLAIVRQLVARSNGTITVESEARRGTTFTVKWAL